jgi:hypothetical protein
MAFQRNPADIALQKAKLEYMKQASKRKQVPFGQLLSWLENPDAIVDKGISME